MAHERHSRYVKWVSVGESFKTMFEEELTLFYKFIEAVKQYILNCKIPQSTCPYEICENAVLLPPGLNQCHVILMQSSKSILVIQTKRTVC